MARHAVARRTNAHALAVSRRLREARALRGLTTRELAKLAMIDGQTLNNILYGRTLNPGSATLADIAKALDVRPGWLTYGEGEGPEA